MIVDALAFQESIHERQERLAVADLKTKDWVTLHAHLVRNARLSEQLRHQVGHGQVLVDRVAGVPGRPPQARLERDDQHALPLRGDADACFGDDPADRSGRVRRAHVELSRRSHQGRRIGRGRCPHRHGEAEGPRDRLLSGKRQHFTDWASCHRERKARARAVRGRLDGRRSSEER